MGGIECKCQELCTYEKELPMKRSELDESDYLGKFYNKIDKYIADNEQLKKELIMLKQQIVNHLINL
jgi:hypothetical protein